MLKKTVTIAVLVAILGACTTATKADDSRYKRFDKYIENNHLTALDKVRTFKMQNWKALDNKHLISSSYHDKSYLISLKNYCNDIEYVPSIAINQSMDNTLEAKFDSIIVANDSNQKCYIDSIYDLSKEQEKAVLALRNVNKK
jgi:hypothetical protein